ncbi:MAG: DUF1653 domain-containing protein [Minisyncoccia bacterium]
MAHASQEELNARLSDAAALVEVGARYVHCKDASKEYVVKSLAILESTEEIAVVYEAQYGDGITFIRPLSNWLETVEWEGKTVPRFQKI